MFSRSAGPDNGNLRSIKGPEQIISELLTFMCKKSWNTGKIPEEWKTISLLQKGHHKAQGHLATDPGIMMEQMTYDCINDELKQN